MQTELESSLPGAFAGVAPFDSFEEVESFQLCSRNGLSDLIEIVKMDTFIWKFS